jgi:hypothetical protein
MIFNTRETAQTGRINMYCGICGGYVYINGDGDMTCQGSCGEILTREEIEGADFDDVDPSGGYEDDGADYPDDGQFLFGDVCPYDHPHGQFDEEV